MEIICNYPKCREVGKFVEFCNKHTDLKKEYSNLFKEHHNKWFLKYYKKTSDIYKKHLARNRVAKAISGGRIKKLPCEKCGDKAQAHHDNYDEPLNVRWLCRFHHMQFHNEVKLNNLDFISR